MSNIFDTVETLVVPRCYVLNHQSLRTTVDFGKLYPVFVKRMIPGETVGLYQATLVKTQPMSAPSMTPMQLYLHTFFVPFRLLDANFERGYVGSTEKGVAVDYAFPIWEPTEDDLKVGSLWDYFGLPLNVEPVSSGSNVLRVKTTNCKGVEPTIYLKRAYNLIYNEWFRNENLIDEVSLDSATIKYRAWKKDYFTSALPFRQKPAYIEEGGELVPNPVYSFPITSMFDKDFIKFGFEHWTSSKQGGVLKNDIVFSNNASSPTVNIAKSGNEYTKVHVKNPIDIGTSVTTDNSSTGYMHVNIPTSDINIINSTFDVADLRFAIQMQKWAERNARAGNRFTEYLRSRFGVAPKDARLQIPEFVGGTKQPILVSDVLQTSATQEDGTALGERGAVANSVGSDFIGKYHCQEPGFIMTLASILPHAEYNQGVNKQFIIHDRLDFVSPEFCLLSERGVQQGELVVSDSSDDETAEAYNTKVFGYQGMYNEFRFLPDLTTGLMRTKFAYWHQTRVLGSSTALNQDFVECHPDNRIFVVQNEDPFMLQMKTDVKDFLPITQHATPGYVDHL